MAIDIDQILSLLNAGQPLMPLKARDKVPTKPWGDVTFSLAEIEAHIEKDGNIGHRLDGLLVIDVDAERENRGAGDIDAIIEKFGIDDSVCAITGGGGYHIYLKLPDGVDTNDLRIKLEDFEGIDFKAGKGSYVVAPGSVHPSGKPYKWDEPWCSGWPKGGPTEAPEELISALLKPKRSPKTTAEPREADISSGLLSEMLVVLNVADFRDHDAWLEIMMACHEATGGFGRDEFIAWSTSDPDYQDHEDKISERWNSLKADGIGGVTRRTLYKRVGEAGRDDLVPVPTAVIEWEDVDLDEDLIETLDEADEHAVSVVKPFGRELQRDGRGNVVKSLNNCVVALDEIGLGFARNKLTERVEVMGDGPLARKHSHAGLTDACLTDVRVALCGQFMVDRFEPSKDMVFDAVMTVAERNAFDPILTYLNTLEWDGVERVGNMCDLFAVEDNELNREFLMRTMVGSVRRQRAPGTKHDTMIVLIGAVQGQGKSSAIEALYGRQFFTDQPLDMRNKDTALVIASHWAVEAAEMDSMTRARVTEVKAFLSKAKDDVRRPYGRVNETLPRRCVIWGTGNKHQGLTDDTGNRRFWPMTVTELIDVVRIAALRDQLWAEAVHMVDVLDESNVLPKHLWETAAERQAEQTAKDPWIEKLEDLLQVRDETEDEADTAFCEDLRRGRMPTSALQSAVGIDRKTSSAEAQRLEAAMCKLGWEKAGVQWLTDRSRAHCYRRTGKRPT